MSYDIAFWRQERSLSRTPASVYRSLCRARPQVEGLADLPLNKILAKLREAFPDTDFTAEFPVTETREGYIGFFWTQKSFVCTIYGLDATANTVVDIMESFDLPLYDPQEDVRYATPDGLHAVATTRFIDPTPEIEALKEETREMLFAEFDAQVRYRKIARTIVWGAVTLMVVAVFWFVLRLWRK